jgi:Tol biopolymer transport system component
MRNTSFIIAIFGVSFISTHARSQVIYPDSQLPSDTPTLFAKDVLSDGLANRDFTISPSGDEIFFTLQQPRFITSTILYMQKQNGKWSKPMVAPFSGRFRDLEASFSPDGQTIYFSSDRPVKGEVAKKDFDLWKVKRLSFGKYGQPENLGMTVNSDKSEYYPSVSKNGDLYFTVEASYGKGSEDIVVCKLTDSGYAKPVSLPEDINTKNDEFNAFIDPDEQFIIFSSYGRPDDLGRGDLYISHRDNSGNWLPVKHLPAPINSAGTDYCPYVTPDKKYLIFTSGRVNNELINGEPKTYDRLKQLLNSPGNGWDDIYWVKFSKDW